MQALIATAKGLLQYNFLEGREPSLQAVLFKGFNVSMVYVDERSNRWWVGVSHNHWGQKLHYSDNSGETWNDVKLPSFKGAKLPSGDPAVLKKIWCMHHGGEMYPDHLWLGTEPGGLFYSKDNGNSFELVEGLWQHPSRKQEDQWFGTGTDFPFVHSIVIDPDDNDKIYVAISSAGIFFSDDRGRSWKPKNRGLKATYLPNTNVEVGHDPHHLLACWGETNVLWQQNHCGIYYSTDSGDNWTEVSGKTGISSYGFSLAIDEVDPAKAWVIPVESDETRTAPELNLRVYHTNNYGKAWTNVSNGLPKVPVFDIVLRQSFSKRKDVLLFGTTNGNLYYSNDTMSAWKNISNHLTKVNAVVLL